MRIGLSLSRCVRDIFEKKINPAEILVIVARTDFDPENDAQWNNIWAGYTGSSYTSAPEWAIYSDKEDEFRAICKRLKEDGKLHQPRQFGAYPTRLPYYWLDTFAPMEEIASNPAAVKAWENYKLIAGLS